MANFLSYIVTEKSVPKRFSLEALSLTEKLCQKHDANHIAIAIVQDKDIFEQSMKNYMPKTMVVVVCDKADNLLNIQRIDVLRGLITKNNPRLVIVPSCEQTKDILGSLAVATHSAALPDVNDCWIEGESVKVKRPVMASKIMSCVQSDQDRVLVSVRAGVFSIQEIDTQPTFSYLDYSPLEPLNVCFKSVESNSKNRVDLQDAQVIVAAGRGIKDKTGRDLIAQLSYRLGAAIGASRALTEEGVYDASLQIGQTGKVVSPALYIAVGISGAIQHVAGMMGSKRILAINTDSNAPIFDIADDGIVGDLYEVIPLMLSSIEKHKSAL